MYSVSADRRAAAGGVAQAPAGHRRARRPAGGIGMGIDLFDCAVPTRLASHGMALAPRRSRGSVERPLRGARETSRPLVEGCPCRACAATPAHICTTSAESEFTGVRLLCVHNLTYLRALDGRAQGRRSAAGRTSLPRESPAADAAPGKPRAAVPDDARGPRSGGRTVLSYSTAKASAARRCPFCGRRRRWRSSAGVRHLGAGPSRLFEEVARRGWSLTECRRRSSATALRLAGRTSATARRFVRAPRYYRGLCRLLESADPAVVHLNSLYATAGGAAGHGPCVAER